MSLKGLKSIPGGPNTDCVNNFKFATFMGPVKSSGGFGTWWPGQLVLGLMLVLLLSGARIGGLLERRPRPKSKLCEGRKNCRVEGKGSHSSKSKVNQLVADHRIIRNQSQSQISGANHNLKSQEQIEMGSHMGESQCSSETVFVSHFVYFDNSMSIFDYHRSNNFFLTIFTKQSVRTHKRTNTSLILEK